MVETPGTAPGSDPLIASAFISIVPKDNIHLEVTRRKFKGDLGQDVQLYQISHAAGPHSKAQNVSAFRIGGLSKAMDSKRPDPAPKYATPSIKNADEFPDMRQYNPKATNKPPFPARSSLRPMVVLVIARSNAPAV